ncbi:MAG: LPS export ABC transporter periplasmic protein LptC [Synergistota bacterium]|jgi:lipopolysaccharide export system protein LptA|nr:LPS export ABC transporter periplasmic protein LptC [Synergistota bacterium]OPZ40344.1 MAG: LPS-assembly protein LptD [Synergistetes bacterium ADurb.BinA166]
MRLSRIVAALSAVLLLLGPALAREVKMTADSMQYDSASGYFTASDNVTITREGLTATARKAEGNMNEGRIDLIGDVRILGEWDGEKVDVRAQVLVAYLQEPTGFTLKGTVTGAWGGRLVEAEELSTRGDAFAVAKLARYSDSVGGYSFSCSSAEGKLKEGEITEFTGKGAFRLVSSPGRGAVTEIRGDRAVYSKARGTIVVNGKVTAVQDGRSLASDSLVYFTKQNRIEATGKPQLVFKIGEGPGKK